MKWIVREPFEGGAYLESEPGMGPVEMSTQRAWLFESEAEACAAIENAARGHEMVTLVALPLRRADEPERRARMLANAPAVADANHDALMLLASHHVDTTPSRKPITFSMLWNEDAPVDGRLEAMESLIERWQCAVMEEP